jgi:hypothetical protein
MRDLTLAVVALAATMVSGCAIQPVAPEYGAREMEGALKTATTTQLDYTGSIIEVLLRKGAIDAVPDWRQHVITADKRGKFEERMFAEGQDECRIAEATGRESFANCQLRHVFAALDRAISAHFAKTPEKPFDLLLSVHGGLVSETAAVSQAKRDVPLMRAGGIYPIFLNWHTGALNSYGDQIIFVRNGERVDGGNTSGAARAAHVAAAPLHVATDIAEGLVRAPVQWASQLADLQSDISDGDPAPNPTYNGARWGAISSANNILSDTDKLSANDHSLERAQYFLTSPFKIATMPFVDGIGRAAWDNMLRRSRAVIKTDEDFQADTLTCQLLSGVNRVCYEHGSGAFARFLTHLRLALEHYRGRHPAKNGADNCSMIRVTLVGHSMGAIVGNDILRDFDLNFCNVVYMAAASSIRHFYNTALLYIERHPGARFYNMMLHPTNDQREDYAWGLVPEGSLLVWIDSFYEESDSVFDRTLGKWQNLGKAKMMLSQAAQKCMVFKVFGIKGRFPTGHGEFNDVLISRIHADGRIDYDYNYWEARFWGDPRLLENARACR